MGWVIMAACPRQFSEAPQILLELARKSESDVSDVQAAIEAALKAKAKDTAQREHVHRLQWASQIMVDRQASR